MAKVIYKTRNRRPGCLFFLIVMAAGLASLFAINRFSGFSLLTNAGELQNREYGIDDYPDLEEIWSCGSGSNKVIRIPLTGLITLKSHGSILSPAGSSAAALKAIHRATLDKSVRALILEIDSCGGGITASDIIYKSLLDFKKQDQDRKVVAIYGDVAASGAYYISLAADHIIARPTSVTGSIGVLVPSVNIYGLAERYGIKDATVKSGSNKDMLNPLAEPSDEQKQIIQGVVNSLYDRFVDLVAQNRHIAEEQVRSLADGRIFTADNALQLKLIDEIGYWDDAMTRTAELIGVDNIIVYRYEPAFSFRDFLRASRKIKPGALLSLPESPRIQYRWQ